jgi:hypothetical protein
MGPRRRRIAIFDRTLRVAQLDGANASFTMRFGSRGCDRCRAFVLNEKCSRARPA